MIGTKKSTCSRLRHRLTLQQEVQTPDGDGGYSKSWQDITNLWAEIIPLTDTNSKLSTSAGMEVVLAGQIQSELSHRILLRYRDSVTSAMRLVFESRVFNIRFVANVDEKNKTLELLVQEGVGT